MPKRHSDEDSDEYIRRKVRKIEKGLRKRKKRSRRQRSSSPDSSGSAGAARTPPASRGVTRSPEPSIHDDVPDVIMLPEEIEDGIQITVEPTAGPHISSQPAAAPSAPTASDKPDEDALELDEDILKLLGETPSKDKKYAPKIQKDLAIRWEHIATSGLTKESRKELLEKHLIPENFKKIDAPLLNAEIKAALSENLVNKDKAIETKQKQLGTAIACLGEALTKMFASENKDHSIIKLLIEAGQLLSDSQHRESMTRRSFICSTIKKEIKDQLYETEIDKYIFGEKLSDTLKAAKAINKSGSEIKNKSTYGKGKTSRPLNSKPPLTTSRPAAVGRRTEPAAPAPAPAAPRRRAAPPPPPPPPPRQRSQAQHRAPHRR